MQFVTSRSEALNRLNKYIENNISNSINGATALKLDENYEIKNDQEQNAVIDSFESNEEKKISENIVFNDSLNETSHGVSIESASYMENNTDLNLENNNSEATNQDQKSSTVEHTPQLFSDENNSLDNEIDTEDKSDDLFDHENKEDEDFEIPAFLRRQKF